MRRFLLVLSLGLLVAAAAVSITVAGPGQSGETSSHREAPLISSDPLADNTDLYAFVSPDRAGTVTLVSNWIPLEEPAGGPNFHKFGDAPEYLYDIHIDNDGDARADITYEFAFRTVVRNSKTFLYATGPITSLTDPDFNVRQLYSVTRYARGSQVLRRSLATPPVNVGPASTPNYEALAEAAIHDLGGGRKVFAGQRDDPFFVDLGAIFDLATIRELPGNAGGGVDGIGGFNTHTIALQLPFADVVDRSCNANDAADMDCTIGVWSTTQRRATTVLQADGSQSLAAGPQVQVSRLGSPLVNEVVIPRGLKDRFNASKPQNDGQFLSFVTDPELAADLNLLYNIGAPTTNRLDLVAVFLQGVPGLNQPVDVTPSEQLRLNVAVPASADENPFGVLGGDNAGFPNGRRLGDDVTDIELRAVCGVTYQIFVDPDFDLNPICNDLGDGVDQNDANGGQFMAAFPYVQTPHSGFDHEHHPVSTAGMAIAAGLGGAGLLLGLGLVAPRVLARREKSS